MREESRALIFGPGLPPGGAPGTLVVSVMGVEIVTESRTQRASMGQVTLREVGFESPGLEVAWQDVDGAWAAHVFDPTSARLLLSSSALAGTPQAASLQRWQRQAATRSVIGRIVLAALVALPIVVLALFLMRAGSIAEWIAERVSIEHERALGQMSFDAMRGGLTLRHDGAAYETTRAIVTRLTTGSRFTYEVHIAQDDTPNAFALPGGIIVVHTGLIEVTKRPEELAGVLAHEVQHVERRHSLRGLVKELGWRGLWAVAMGDVAGSMAGQAVAELTSLQFSRDHEREADLYGFDALVNAGIDPSGLPAFFATLSAISGSQVPAFLSTHPPSEDRDRTLQQRLSTVAGRTFAPLPPSVWPPQ
jgi:predicted Zn-dependent protease